MVSPWADTTTTTSLPAACVFATMRATLKCGRGPRRSCRRIFGTMSAISVLPYPLSKAGARHTRSCFFFILPARPFRRPLPLVVRHEAVQCKMRQLLVALQRRLRALKNTFASAVRTTERMVGPAPLINVASAPRPSASANTASPPSMSGRRYCWCRLSRRPRAKSRTAPRRGRCQQRRAGKISTRRLRGDTILGSAARAFFRQQLEIRDKRRER